MTKCEVCQTKTRPWELYVLPLPGRTMRICQNCGKATRTWLESWEAANKAQADKAAEDTITKARGKG